MLDAVIGLGGNQGDPVQTFVSALSQLAPLVRLRSVSPLYQTAPLGGPAQPDFHNAAARVEVAGDPLQLLTQLQQIEQAHGRERLEHWGPRTLDLDLLWIDGAIVDHPRLTLPHPRLLQRAFALVPLVSLVPEARDPRTGRRYSAAVLALGIAGLRALADPRWEALRGSLGRR